MSPGIPVSGRMPFGQTASPMVTCAFGTGVSVFLGFLVADAFGVAVFSAAVVLVAFGVGVLATGVTLLTPVAGPINAATYDPPFAPAFIERLPENAAAVPPLRVTALAPLTS